MLFHTRNDGVLGRGVMLLLQLENLLRCTILVPANAQKDLERTFRVNWGVNKCHHHQLMLAMITI